MAEHGLAMGPHDDLALGSALRTTAWRRYIDCAACSGRRFKKG